MSRNFQVLDNIPYLVLGILLFLLLAAILFTYIYTSFLLDRKKWKKCGKGTGHKVWYGQCKHCCAPESFVKYKE